MPRRSRTFRSVSLTHRQGGRYPTSVEGHRQHTRYDKLLAELGRFTEAERLKGSGSRGFSDRVVTDTRAADPKASQIVTGENLKKPVTNWKLRKGSSAGHRHKHNLSDLCWTHSQKFC